MKTYLPKSVHLTTELEIYQDTSQFAKILRRPTEEIQNKKNLFRCVYGTV